jgi:hypothetical protein
MAPKQLFHGDAGSLAGNYTMKIEQSQSRLVGSRPQTQQAMVIHDLPTRLFSRLFGGHVD